MVPRAMHHEYYHLADLMVLPGRWPARPDGLLVWTAGNETPRRSHERRHPVRARLPGVRATPAGHRGGAAHRRHGRAGLLGHAGHGRPPADGRAGHRVPRLRLALEDLAAFERNEVEPAEAGAGGQPEVRGGHATAEVAGAPESLDDDPGRPDRSDSAERP